MKRAMFWLRMLWECFVEALSGLGLYRPPTYDHVYDIEDDDW